MITPEGLSEALALFGWVPKANKAGITHLYKTGPWPPNGHTKVTQEVRALLDRRYCTFQVKLRVKPTESNPARMAWVSEEPIRYADVNITSSGHLMVGPYTF